MNRKICLMLIILSMTLLVGCYGTVDWYESNKFTGTVDEILMEEKVLKIREYAITDKEPTDIVYEIPVDNLNEYEVGNNLHVVIETNTLEDVWDLDHLRFTITPIE
ncbi:hypothetical protein WAK64_13545 [Bacillus spongiae]|uniref:DUF3221 domain-containing protein n=1 Tax=Bacillus spongiae TaxID=2683610 RepID=A0ABU8HFC2_9BACI